MAPLVAAVSNAGGLGVIGGATLTANGLRREIRKTRELTDKPFAVDLLAPIPDMIQPHMQVVFEEKIAIFVAGPAVPREFIAEMLRLVLRSRMPCASALPKPLRAFSFSSFALFGI